MTFKIKSSPHISVQLQTATVMQRVILCALPGLLAQIVCFGWGNLIQVILAISLAVGFEACILKLRNRPILISLKDYSAIVTGLLLGLALPPLAPWWLMAIGIAFAIVIVKHLYGGLGHNLFNPAMAAYVLLLVSFPVQMTSWVAPSNIALASPSLMETLQVIFELKALVVAQFSQGIDGVTMATPLDTFKTDLTMGLTSTEILAKPLFVNGVSQGWFYVNLAYLAGGIMMIKLKVIRWQISTAVIGSLAICSTLGFMFGPDTHPSPLIHLFSGATMIAAFFIATDPVTAATSNKGRLIFGAIIGILVYVIRTFGGYPDAFAFAVLLANLCAPFIDHYVRPKTYGHRINY